MDIIAMTAFAAAVSKTGPFKLRDEFPYLGRHTIIPILLPDATYSLCSLIGLSTPIAMNIGAGTATESRLFPNGAVEE